MKSNNSLILLMPGAGLEPPPCWAPRDFNGGEIDFRNLWKIKNYLIFQEAGVGKQKQSPKRIK
jgi:hypothetical protein